MKHRLSIATVVTFLSMTLLLSSCSLAGDLFKGGIWIGAIGVVAIVALIIYVISRMGNKS